MLSTRADPHVCLSCGGRTTRPYLDCAACRMARRLLTEDERRANRALLALINDRAAPVALRPHEDERLAS